MTATLRSSALGTLASWSAPTVDQEALRVRYVDYLAGHPSGVFREDRPHHLTASTLVLSADGGSVLLTLHAKAQRWFQFGGHLEPADETLVAAATREATEESGLAGLVLDPVPVQLSDHEVPFCGESADGSPVHHLDVRFLAVAPAGAVHAVSEESLDVRWFPIDALPTEDPDMHELVGLALARCGLASL
ncbi:NUDIX hydrolase [Nocardioides sp. Kera G14]|uniref:NUDIX hydrolase n=1 Tax=Nocardioides sp. Kera G14 TaxID=2884264 RepID=UPI001D107790|nr:NUDIX hydrolase [Nocardioides sp. Kera G14]UDY24608.1 NUDIX hydrolase [Nocardioides sp. Kera G14]